MPPFTDRLDEKGPTGGGCERAHHAHFLLSEKTPAETDVALCHTGYLYEGDVTIDGKKKTRGSKKKRRQINRLISSFRPHTGEGRGRRGPPRTGGKKERRRSKRNLGDRREKKEHQACSG